MATLVLVNGKEFKIREQVLDVDAEMDIPRDWAVFILAAIQEDNQGHKHKLCRFMKTAIAYWY